MFQMLYMIILLVYMIILSLCKQIIWPNDVHVGLRWINARCELMDLELSNCDQIPQDGC